MRTVGLIPSNNHNNAKAKAEPVAEKSPAKPKPKKSTKGAESK